MYGSRIVSGLAVVLGGMAVLFGVLAVAYNLVFLFVAAVFGLSAYFVWYHASGKLARRVYSGVESQARPGATGGFGAGPRAEWEPPGEGARVGEGARRATAGRGAGGGARGSTSASASDGLSAREAYDALGLDPDADDGEVSAAYRRKVKEVHPDTDGGDEESFKEVQAAYERLSE